MYLSLSLLVLSNLFMLWNRFFGISSTIKLIKRCATLTTASDESLESISNKVDKCRQRAPYLFLFRKQKCLIRGYLLYFFGKNTGRDIRLVFGATKTNCSGLVAWHCWILEQDQIKFEVPTVIEMYVPFIEYT